jgi:hypothetical protein
MTEYADVSRSWLQAAIARLSADTTLQTLITGAYVHPPEALSPPYLLLSPPRLQMRQARGKLVAQGESVFTLWSPVAAVNGAHNVLERVEVVMLGSALSLSPHYLAVMRLIELQCHRTQQRDLAASIVRLALWIEGV